MKEIDLHGIGHEQAKELLEITINKLWCINDELCIITGHSDQMKKIVIDILEDYKLDYTIGDFSGRNMGFIKTFLD